MSLTTKKKGTHTKSPVRGLLGVGEIKRSGGKAHFRRRTLIERFCKRFHEARGHPQLTWGNVWKSKARE